MKARTKSKKQTQPTEMPVTVQLEHVEIGNGLQNIGEAAKGLKLSLPKLPMVPNLSGLNATVDEMNKAVQDINEGVANAVKFIDETYRAIDACKNNIELKVVKRAREATADKMQSYINDVLGHKDEILKAAAAVAYIRTVLSRQHDSEQEAREALAELGDHKLLVMSEKGPIIIGYHIIQSTLSSTWMQMTSPISSVWLPSLASVWWYLKGSGAINRSKTWVSSPKSTLPVSKLEKTASAWLMSQRNSIWTKARNGGVAAD